MKYSDIVLDHFRHPRNGGALPEADGVGTAGSLGQGAFLRLFLRLEGERVAQATFQTYGCGPAIAAGSLLTELIQGQTLADCAAITAEGLTEALGGLPPDKEHCAALAVDALRQALQALDFSGSQQSAVSSQQSAVSRGSGFRNPGLIADH
jgi:nitrogen fixation NifU-like protein